MLGKQLQATFRDLRQKYGITADELTAEELDALIKAAERFENPFADLNAAICGMPYEVCKGVYLWELTIGASVWLDTYAARWYDTKHEHYFWALVYALMNARNPEAFINLTTESAAYEAIHKCAMRLAVNKDALKHAVEKVLNLKPGAGNSADDDKPKHADWEAIIARLEGQTGEPAEKWIWGHSALYCSKVYNDLSTFAAAVMAGGETKRAQDELDLAINAVRRVRKQIVQRIKAEKGNNE